MTTSADRWQRLGALLIQRRTEISPHLSRGAFSKARGLSYRLIYDIEEGKRPNFGTTTLAGIEAAYDLEPGSIGRFLDGGELQPSGPAPLAPVTPLENRRPRVTPELAEKMQPLVAAADDYVTRAEIRHFGHPLTEAEELDPRYRLSGAQVFGPGTPDAITWDLDLIPGRTNRLAGFLMAAVWQHLADDAAQRQRGRASNG